MGAPTFSSLTDKEWDWIQNQLDTLPVLVEAYSPDDVGQPVTLAVLDRVFASFLALGIQDAVQINGVINIIGIRFGQFLADEVGFQWVIATDRHGSDLAVLALPGTADVLIYPANFVAKRWERRESDFIADAFETTRQQLERIKADWSGGRSRRPWWQFWKSSR